MCVSIFRCNSNLQIGCPVVGMTSFDAEIRGRISSFWSLGVPIFFHVDLDRMLQDASVSTKNGNLRLLMVTGMDGDDVVVPSSLLMVGFITRLTLNDFCFVMQACFNVSLPAAEFANWVGQSAILHRMAFLSTTITLCRCTGWSFGRW